MNSIKEKSLFLSWSSEEILPLLLLYVVECNLASGISCEIVPSNPFIQLTNKDLDKVEKNI